MMLTLQPMHSGIRCSSRCRPAIGVPALRLRSKGLLSRATRQTPPYTPSSSAAAEDEVAAPTGTQRLTVSPIDPEELTAKVNETVGELKTKWDGVEEKPAAVAITLSALVAVWALNGVVTAIDSLPIINSVFEVIGLVVTTWFVYRYLIFGPDREELKQNISDFWAKVIGEKK